jgi:hypothetical protein
VEVLGGQADVERDDHTDGRRDHDPRGEIQPEGTSHGAEGGPQALGGSAAPLGQLCPQLVEGGLGAGGELLAKIEIGH